MAGLLHAIMAVTLTLLACVNTSGGQELQQSSSRNNKNQPQDMEMQALLEFKRQITSDPNSLLRSWNKRNSSCQPCSCNWYGVTCSPAPEHRVTALRLSRGGLSGRISAQLANLTSLTTLDLAHNAFTSTLPSSLGRLARLTLLSVSDNGLRGAIPPELGNASALRRLDLSRNSFGGRIPPELGLLSSLTDLRLDNNSALGGPLPPELGRLRRLQVFYAFNNRHTGSVPASLCNCSELRQLRLSANGFHGHVPPEIGLLSKLTFLALTENALGGPIPASVSNLTALRTLDLGQNHLRGPLPRLRSPRLRELYFDRNAFSWSRVPESLANFSSLQVLSLTENGIRGTVPPWIGKLRNLQVLELGINNLTGPLPESMTNVSGSLVELSLDVNDLQGPLPPWLGGFGRLQKLYVGGNRFTGGIPESLGNATRLRVVDLVRNDLHGTVPPSLGKLSALELLNVGKNNLGSSGNGSVISVLRSLRNCSRLGFLGLGENRFAGTLPPELGNLWPALQYLTLQENSISGPIPASVGNFSQLIYLNLALNLMQGTIPSSISGMKLLQFLNLGGNGLHGRIPPQIAEMNSSLNFLYLWQNQLSGPIPAAMGELSALRLLHLGSNRFTGSIPREIAKCELLEHLHLCSNELSGTIPEEMGALSNINGYFNLSRNELSGAVPPGLSHLQMAQFIDLSHNRLSGNLTYMIPAWLNAQSIDLSCNNFSGVLLDSVGTGITELQTIDLSRNNFSGRIPESLLRLPKIEFLNLASNFFEGEINCTRIFRSSLELVSVSGNPGLCGECLRLARCHHHHHHHGRKGPTRKTILIASLVGGIAAGISIIATALVLRLSKKKPRTTAQNQLTAELQGLEQGWISMSADEVREATDNFSPALLLAQGCHGQVYKAHLRGPNLQQVAIKVFWLSEETKSQMKSFLNECKTLGQIRHRNLMKILNICYAEDFLALIMPFMSNGSLHGILHGPPTNMNPVSMRTRIRILKEVASAISYLHHDCTPPVIHCDIKPQNILLDEDMTVKLSDFGISHALISCDGATSSTFSSWVLQGTFGYFAPEYGVEGRISSKTDVYSFGVVVLEVLTGKQPTDNMFAEESSSAGAAAALSLRSWVSSMTFDNDNDEAALKSIILWNMDDKDDQYLWDNGIVQSLVKLGLICTVPDPHKRPTMRQVETLMSGMLS